MSNKNEIPHILLAEDDLAIALLYKTKLEIDGYQIKHALNGLEALIATRNNSYDLVLLDLKMPIMSGEEFLAKFRNNSKNKEIPVIVLTNISRSEAPKTLWHYGVQGYFVKAHLTPKELAGEVSKIINTFK